MEVPKKWDPKTSGDIRGACLGDQELNWPPPFASPRRLRDLEAKYGETEAREMKQLRCFKAGETVDFASETWQWNINIV